MSQSKSHLKSVIINMTIIGLLASIAIVIFKQQFEFNPAVTALSAKKALSQRNSDMADAPKQAVGPGDSLPSELKPIVRLVTPLQPLSASESFNAETLSDKIDGKAELYLPAGFKSLTCQRFKVAVSSFSSSASVPDHNAESDALNSASSDNASSPSDLWIELFIYDMTLPENAFAVFSRQRRENSTQVSIATYAYQTENALFFVHRHFYIEMIASSPSVDAVKLMTNLGEAFIHDRPDLTAPKKMDVPEIFPIQGLDKESITLITSDAFGFDLFDNVYIASYTLNGSNITAKNSTISSDISTITAFISKRDSSKEAADLAAKYAEFLAKFGGNKIDSGMEGVHGIEIMDTIELVFSVGQYIAGVRETENMKAATNLAHQIQVKITDH